MMRRKLFFIYSSLIPLCSIAQKLTHEASPLSSSRASIRSKDDTQSKRSLNDIIVTFTDTSYNRVQTSSILDEISVNPEHISVQITGSPTPSPTEKPTKSPTREPTKSPTNKPTRKPTRRPTPSPTPIPTIQHSRGPSTSPTPYPTADPTTSPTPYPTAEPTPTPTSLPTSSPTSSPTYTPTVSPTLTHNPTSSPTSQPSSSPTSLPTSSPSSLPTSSPTASPSSSPTSSPTLSLQEFMLTYTTMEFDDCQFMSRDTIHLWERQTEYHIYEDLIKRNVSLFQLYINVTMTKQDIPVSSSIASASSKPEEYGHVRSLLSLLPFQPRRQQGQSLRSGIEEKQPLRVHFYIYMSFRSTRYDHDIRNYVGDAFKTPDRRNTYISRLQETGDRTFVPISKMSITIGGVMQEEEWDDDDGSGGQRKEGVGATADGGEEGEEGGIKAFEIAVGVGFILAVASGVFAVGYYVITKRGGGGVVDGIVGRSGRSGEGASKTMTSSVKSPQNVTAFIDCDDQCDVSTIGYPESSRSVFMTVPMPTKDICEESVMTNNYAFSLAAGAGSGTSVSTASEFASRTAQGSQEYIPNDDDMSFEQQFQTNEEYIEVDVPPGRLGVVIDTPNNGAPVVHAIKDDSVIAGKVREGDRLISVDGEDTSQMTALEVSSVLARKARRPKRSLVFLRSRQ